MTTATAADLLRLRHAAQLLSLPAGGGVEGVAAVARRMLALQGQDPVAVRWALGVRSAATHGDVLEAYRAGLIVRSWPMRGTVHVVPAEDLGWLQRLVATRVLASAPQRRAFLGLELSTIERMREIAQSELEGGRAATRSALVAAFERDGIEMRTGWAYHCIWYLSQTGTLVGGPPGDGRENLFALAEEWIAAPRPLEGDEALAELASRYLDGHGPATAADLAWWSGLTVTACRRAFAIAEADGRAARADVDDVAHWFPSGLDAAALPEVPAVQLLPAFDELLLGFKDRTASVAPEHARAVMSSNGIASPTLMLAGRVAGIWSRRGASVDVVPFDGAVAGEASALSDQVARVTAFFEG